MKNKLVFVFMTLFLLTLALALISYSNPEEKEKDKIITFELQELISQSETMGYNFSHPYIKCYFDGNCNGTFYISLQVNLENNLTEILEIVKGYGSYIHYSNYSNSISLRTSDFYDLAGLLNRSFIEKFEFEFLETDFKEDFLGDSLYSCKVEEDCVKVSQQGCVEGLNFINKDYENLLQEYYRIRTIGIACGGVITPPSIRTTYVPKCIENQCNGMFELNSFCNQTAFIWEDYNWIGEKDTLFSDSNLTLEEIDIICDENTKNKN